MKTVNEYGLECPIDWDEISANFDWIAIDYDGDIFAYGSMPVNLDGMWVSSILSDDPDSSTYIKECDPPTDASKCLWERPSYK